MSNIDIREKIAQKIINVMEDGYDSWRKTWKNPLPPFNPISGTKYGKHNFLLLAFAKKVKENEHGDLESSFYKDPRWCTFNQAKKHGYNVKKGESATEVYFYDIKHGIRNNDSKELEIIYTKNEYEFFDKFAQKFSNNSATKLAEDYKNKFNEKLLYNQKTQLYSLFVNEISKMIKDTFQYAPVYLMKEHKVFNFEQLDNVPEISIIKNEFKENDRAERIIESTKANIITDQFGMRNYYLPSSHEIHLTPKEYFESENAYYATALHELAHWTMGEGVTRSYGEYDIKDEEQYANEELVAELSSIFTCAEIGLPYDIQNHTNYLGFWSEKINEDANYIFKAVKDASKISDYLIGLEQVHKLEIEESNEKLIVTYTITDSKKIFLGHSIEDVNNLLTTNGFESADITKGELKKFNAEDEFNSYLSNLNNYEIIELKHIEQEYCIER